MTDLERAQKTQAAKLFQLLACDNYFIHNFVEEDTVFIFDRNGYKATRLCYVKKIAAKVKELRDNYGYEVYAVTHEITSFGECYSFLIVPKYPEDWDKLYRPLTDGVSCVYAYVWNTTHEECSESGYIAVKFKNGILWRVG